MRDPDWVLCSCVAFKNLLVVEEYFFANSPNPPLPPSPTPPPPPPKKSKTADQSQKHMKTQIAHVYNGNNGENCGGPLFFRELLCLKGQNVAHEGQRNWAEDQCRENKLKGDDNQWSRIFLYFPKKALLA